MTVVRLLIVAWGLAVLAAVLVSTMIVGTAAGDPAAVLAWLSLPVMSLGVSLLSVSVCLAATFMAMRIERGVSTLERRLNALSSTRAEIERKAGRAPHDAETAHRFSDEEIPF